VGVGRDQYFEARIIAIASHFLFLLEPSISASFIYRNLYHHRLRIVKEASSWTAPSY